VQNELAAIRQDVAVDAVASKQPGISRAGVKKSQVLDYSSLNLVVDSVTVEDMQDTRNVIARRRKDEVSFNVQGLYPDGSVAESYTALPAVREHRTAIFNRTLHTFDTDVGADKWPRNYFITVTAIERDRRGGWNKALDALRKLLNDNAKEWAKELGEAVGALAETVLGKLGKLIGKALAWALEKVIKWFAKIITGLGNNDDIVDHETAVLTIDQSPVWGEKSEPWSWEFAGKGGRWVAKFHWELSNTGLPKPGN